MSGDVILLLCLFGIALYSIVAAILAGGAYDWFKEQKLSDGEIFTIVALWPLFVPLYLIITGGKIIYRLFIDT